MTETSELADHDVVAEEVQPPAEPWAAFYATPDELPIDLTPHLAQLRQIERAERAAAAETAERVEDHRERAYQLAIAESISRAHANGQQWDPADPLRFYPTIAERIEQGFAVADAMAAREARAAKREAAKVLAAHGVSGQVVVDVGQVSPAAPVQVPVELPGSTPPSGPASRAVKARIRRFLVRHPRPSVKEAHPIAGPDNWVPDRRDVDTGEMVRLDWRIR